MERLRRIKQKTGKQYMRHSQVGHDHRQTGRDPLGPSKEPCRMSLRIVHPKDRRGYHLSTGVFLPRSQVAQYALILCVTCEGGLLFAIGIPAAG